MALVSWRMAPLTEWVGRLSPSFSDPALFDAQVSDSSFSLVTIREPSFDALPVAPLIWRTYPELVFARLQPDTRAELRRVFAEERVLAQVLTSQEALGSNLAERINNWAVPLIPFLEGTYHPDKKVQARLRRKQSYIADITALIAEEKRLGSPVAASFWRQLLEGDHRVVKRLHEIQTLEQLFAISDDKSLP